MVTGPYSGTVTITSLCARHATIARQHRPEDGESNMTKERYEETQTDPHRIAGTERGKAAAMEFLAAMRERDKAGEIDWTDTPPDLRELTNAIALLTKYMYGMTVDEVTGKNSFVMVHVKRSDGEQMLWANVLGEEDEGRRIAARHMTQCALGVDPVETADIVLDELDKIAAWRDAREKQNGIS